MTATLCVALILSVGIGAAYGADYKVHKSSVTITYSSLKKITKATWKKSTWSDWDKMQEYKKAGSVEDAPDDLGDALLMATFMKGKVTFSSKKKLSEATFQYFAETGKDTEARVTIAGKTYKGKVDKDIWLDDSKINWGKLSKKKKYAASVKVMANMNFSKSDAYEILAALDNTKSGDKIVTAFKIPKLKTKYTQKNEGPNDEWTTKITYKGISKLSSKSFTVTETIK
ncbi:MAG: hypothetical protein LBS67_00160 [Clostridiales Family XIII bacterium]|nr:hypothetical protein [Clostridiales Family XIII bacterium]